MHERPVEPEGGAGLGKMCPRSSRRAPGLLGASLGVVPRGRGTVSGHRRERRAGAEVSAVDSGSHLHRLGGRSRPPELPEDTVGRPILSTVRDRTGTVLLGPRYLGESHIG
jgi:hypothetical protein